MAFLDKKPQLSDKITKISVVLFSLSIYNGQIVKSDYESITERGKTMNKNWLTGFVMSTALLASPMISSPVSAAGVNFTDINNSYAKNAIMNLAEAGIVNGVSNELFNPTGKITRQDFAIILAKALNLDVTGTPLNSTFKDIPQTHYAFSYVEAASKAGLVKGYGNGEFGLNDTLSRQDLAIMFVRALNVDSTGYGSKLQFTDSKSISNYAKDAVGFAVEAGLLKGIGNNTFDPKGIAVRQDVAIVASRFLSVKDEYLNPEPTPEPTPDPEPLPEIDQNPVVPPVTEPTPDPEPTPDTDQNPEVPPVTDPTTEPNPTPDPEQDSDQEQIVDPTPEEDFNFDGELGASSFNVYLQEGETATVGTIPSGVSNIFIQLDAGLIDVDLEIWEETEEGSQIPVLVYGNSESSQGDSEFQSTWSYNGLQFTYSGWTGVNDQYGKEWITIEGTTNKEYTIKVKNYDVDTNAKVDYSWGNIGESSTWVINNSVVLPPSVNDETPEN